MGKTKRRIDKKNALTFKVVNRSQFDPLVADETAPQHVLVPCSSEKEQESRKEEQKKYGIYFDDEYDYLQHLKDVNNVPDVQWHEVEKTSASKPKVMLPSSLFASRVEEDEGMLSKGVLPVGPQVNWDPDLVAALDDDFDFDNPDNQLEDDFMTAAMGGESEEQEEDETTDDESNSDDDDENDCFDDEEVRTCFTNYSVSSSVIRRNEGLRTLDERFETLYEQEYADDTEIGALDLEDIEGRKDINDTRLMSHLLADYERVSDRPSNELNSEADLKKRILNRSDENDELVDIDIYTQSKNAKECFDCESVVSSYSTIYNHPKLIKEPNKIHLSRKGIPIIDKPGLTADKLRKLDASNEAPRYSAYGAASTIASRASRLSEISVRPPNETLEEKKERKAALKEYRRERRCEKKSNREAFKQENLKQDRAIANVGLQLNSIRLV